MDFESLAQKKDGSHPSFHSTRIHALQRENGHNDAASDAFLTPETSTHPLISEVFHHLSRNSADPLTQSWTGISAKTHVLCAQLEVEADLKKRLNAVQQRISSLKSELSEELQPAQTAADQLLSEAALRAEVSRLTYSQLTERLNLNLA